MERTGKIRICKGIKLDKTYNNVLDYSESSLLALCESSSHLVASANDYSFIRARGTISVNFTYSQCLQANYMAFQNKDYDNKWFFAFIDNVKFITEGTTEIEYTIDSWSTWYDNWTRSQCFVIREHTNDDTIGANTIPENLDVGQVIAETTYENGDYLSSSGYYIGVLSSWEIKDNSDGTGSDSDKGSQYSGISVLNNTIYGERIFLFSISSQYGFDNLDYFIVRTNADGHIADIKSIFIIPYGAVTPADLTQHTASVVGHSFNWYTLPFSYSAKIGTTNIAKKTSFTGISVKNNKCFVYPYNYLLVTNNQGSNNIYRYEDFSTTNCSFEQEFSISIGGSGRIVPKNYKGMALNDDEAIPLGKFPTCAWSGDAFTNWLTQNSVNMAVSVGLTAGGIASSIATGGATLPLVLGGLMTASSSVGGLIGQFHQASLLPNISGGQATGDVIWTADRSTISIKEMRVKNEYLRVIDEYFTKFGYKTNRLKLPNLTGRTYWNYIEIDKNDVIGHGNVPNVYMDEINNIARKGVTIWHNHDNIGNYSLSNTIVT